MQRLIHNSRFWILLGSFIVGLSIALHYGFFTEEPLYGKLVRTYAFWAAGLLFFALSVSPFIRVFPSFQRKAELIHARRAIGVSSAFFATLHAYLAFNKQLGGFAGLPYLTERYLVAITAAGIALLILWVMAATSFDSAVRKLGPLWKKIHRLVYVAGFLILFHALSLGSHLTDLRTPTARFILLLVFALLLGQALRLDWRYRPKGMRIGVFSLAVITIASYSLAAFAGPKGESPVSVHSTHTKSRTVDMQSHYSLSLATNPQVPVPGQPTTFTITIFDAATGSVVTEFATVNERKLHLLVLDSNASELTHVHPELSADGTFTAVHTFTHEDRYRLYFRYTPEGDTEQHAAQQLLVGTKQAEPLLKAGPIPRVTYQGFTLETTSSLYDAEQVRNGKELLGFTVSHPDGVDLQPYLGALGHLTLIRDETFEILHAHTAPASPASSKNHASGNLSFVLEESSLRAGSYRAFLEIAPAGTPITIPIGLLFE